MINLDPLEVESWESLYLSAQNEEEKKQVLQSLAKHITLRNYWLKNEIRGYVLKRMGEMDAEDRVDAFRRQKAADLKKLDDRIRDRKKALCSQ